MTIAKFETLKGGSRGPNALNRITRNEYFRVWLVAVEESKVSDLNSYGRLMQLEWGYQFDCSVRLEGDQLFVVRSDSPWHYVKFGDYMDPIPPEALSAPVATKTSSSTTIEMAIVKPRQG